MQRIVPNLWFDHKAAEATDFYLGVFPDARRIDTKRYPTEGLLDFQQELAGDVLYEELEIRGYRLTAINAGDEVTPNPSISFMLTFDETERDLLDGVYAALSEGGQVLMALDTYEFNSHYGWVSDRYGISWQLFLGSPNGQKRPFIMPSLLFTEAVRKRAEEAITYYTSVFSGEVGTIARYPEDGDSPVAGGVMYGDFQLLDQWFAAMDSGFEHGFTFNFGVSLMVSCTDQEELDRWWSQLSHVPEAEQCGWCADQFGVSWQLVPADLEQIMSKPGAYAKLMGMKKIEIAAFG
jgi:predicted 3-demethylubiquinone-9 3-methyltransferase (glyoxalase superfamily)